MRDRGSGPKVKEDRSGGFADKMKGREHVQQLQEVKARLVALGEYETSRRPLLIPFGTKAFFHGSLNTASYSIDRAGNGQEFEHVESTEDAIKLLNATIDAQKARKPTAGNSKASVSKSSSVAISTEKPSTSPSPFVDIREEMDANGATIGQSVVDITKFLQHTEGKDEQARTNTIQGVSPNGSEEIGSDEMEQLEPSPSPRGASDDEYKLLTARFEELAKLEEQEKQNESVPSIKKQQKQRSTGWAKGFLNEKPKSRQNNREIGPTDESSVSRPPQRLIAPSTAARTTINDTVVKGAVSERKQRRSRKAETPTKPKRRSRFSEQRQGLR